MNNLELELEDFTLAQLESCSYRYLQKVTKSMNLPSNFKKIYLIEMIRAKRYGTPEALEKIITRVREERIANSLLKKQQRRMKLENTENTSALEQQLRSLSPALTTTPKHRPSYVAKYRNTHPIAKYSQRNIIHQSCVRRPDFDGVLRPMCLKKSESDKVLNLECGNTTESDKVLNLKCGNTTESDQVLNLKCGHTTESDKVLSPTFKSDRVLRSCNIRVKPAYTHLNIPIVNAVNNRNDTLQYSHVKKFKLNTYQIANPIRIPAFNVKNGNAQTHKVYFGRSCQREKQKNVEERQKIDVPNSSPRPAKRQRLISSISPIKLGESYESPRMYYRRKDGTITKINVIRSTEKNVYKKRAAKMATEDVQSCCVSIQDIINYNVNKSTKQPRKERQDPRSVTQKENVETYIKSRVLVEKLNENAMIESETLIQSKKTNYGLESAECSFTETRIFNPEIIISSTETHFERNAKFNDITPNVYNNQVHADNATIRNERFIQTKYPNMSALTDYPLNYTLANLNSNTQDEFSLYYHSKYGAAQTISQGNAYNPLAATSSYGTLPNISEVFNQFNNAQYAQCKDYTQPLYVHVSQESEILPIRRLNKDGSVLESIYNYKNQYISREPVLQIAKPMNTTYVFSTPTIATAVAHQSVGPMPQHNSYQQREEEIYNEDNDFMPRLYDCLRMVEQDITMSCDEGLSSMNSCISQEETNDMVEDALELISQDGDYMERIQMDMKMQCIICDWAGPRNDLEIHILREHESQIMESNQTQCVVSFPISILWSLQPVHRIVKLQQNLYILTGFCLPSDCFVAVLSALPTEHEELPTYGTLTVYNKVTKEAFQWDGEIPQISETIPYETELNGLKLDITSLNLLPNIPDLNLVNGDLISNSTSEVVICKSELENININVNVQVFDWM